jgi:hypothetical protein
MKKVTIQCDTGNVDMSVDEFTRWMCLVEAFDFIEKKAEELNIDTEELLKPNAIDEYIHGNETKKFSGRFDSMRHDVICELALGNI